MNALICLHPGFEEIEAIVPIDLLSRAEVEVTQAAIGDSLQVTGRSRITVQADLHLSECDAANYDLVVLPGGPGISKLRDDPKVCSILKAQANAGGWIGCICAAPLMLKDAGLHVGKRIVCHPSAENELEVSSQEAVVVDRRLITSRGAGTATEFALALVEALKGRAEADAITKSICWSHT